MALKVVNAAEKAVIDRTVKNKFKFKWLDEIDCNGVKLETWIKLKGKINETKIAEK